ncbi:reverse transcriptase [Caerostris extrusa]|uniref:Reverse transcriptase n=1 Tax=Caerostris extrusa TaxID=172846 RepID=A0AAV4QBI5_CAEEX|nr:reverse transcriptase [Caerostris extrusa]
MVGKMDSVEIHIFSDAFIVAYGAVAYFRYVNSRGEVGTSFVMSKSRISPLKKLSLPRLELMGALIAARLWKYLPKGVLWFGRRGVFCGHSEICLCWIKGSAREWKQVRNNFWIPRGRQVIKKVISECLICKKYALKPAKQLTGQLPRDRVAESPPFAVVGIDFTGTITIKEGDQSCKKV